VIRFRAEAAAAVREHARRIYAEECCGVLYGRSEGADKRVEAVVELPNSRDGERHRRFLITAEDYRRAEAEAGRLRLELLGFYHSHPDHPARPSDYDREHALPNFSYVILSVAAGRPADLRSYVLREDRSGFLDEELQEV
jgi:proteasome lid subunit RPN8/RPN11